MKKHRILIAAITLSSLAPTLPTHAQSSAVLALGYTSAGLLLSISTERLISLIGSPRKRAAIKKLLAEKSSTRRTRAIIYLALSAVGITAGITLGACTGRHQYRLRKESNKPKETPATLKSKAVLEDAPPVHESRDGAGNPAHHRPAAQATGPVSDPTAPHRRHTSPIDPALENDLPGSMLPTLTSRASSRQSTPLIIDARTKEKEEKKSGSQTPEIVSGHGRSLDHSPSPEAPDTGLSTSPRGAASVAINLYKVHFTAPTESDLDTTLARHTAARRNIAAAVSGLSAITPRMLSRHGHPPLGRSKSAYSPRSRLSRFIIPTDHDRSLLVATPAGSTESTPAPTPTPTPALTPVVSPEASPTRAGAGSGGSAGSVTAVVAARSPRSDRLPFHITTQTHAQHRSASDTSRTRYRKIRALAQKATTALHLTGRTLGELLGQNKYWLVECLPKTQNELLFNLACTQIDIQTFKDVLKEIHDVYIMSQLDPLALPTTTKEAITTRLNEALQEFSTDYLDTSFRSPL